MDSTLRAHGAHQPLAQLHAAIAYYALCSSLLLITNKIALVLLPAPTVLLAIQLWTTVFAVYAFACLNIVQVKSLRCSTAVAFAPVVVCFLGTLFANAKVLQYSNVETFITFRSSTPIVLCICDYVFLGRRLPSLRSAICLIGLLVSSAGYALFDHAFDVRAYGWLAVWYMCFTGYEVVVKHTCDSIPLDNWTRVLYTNAMAGGMLLLAMPVAPKDYNIARSVTWNVASVSVIACSCVFGIGASHSAYVMRSMCSATLSAVVGIVCKVVTVAINMIIWDKHASGLELAFLAIGLISGAMYRQAPMRAPAITPEVCEPVRRSMDDCKS